MQENTEGFVLDEKGERYERAFQVERSKLIALNSLERNDGLTKLIVEKRDVHEVLTEEIVALIVRRLHLIRNISCACTEEKSQKRSHITTLLYCVRWILD